MHEARSTIRVVLGLSMAVALVGCSPTEEPLNIESPDGALSFELVSDNERLRYRIWSDGELVLSDSDLGLQLDGSSLVRLSLVDSGEVESIASSYRMIGESQPIAVEANQRTFSFENEDGVGDD